MRRILLALLVALNVLVWSGHLWARGHLPIAERLVCLFDNDHRFLW